MISLHPTLRVALLLTCLPVFAVAQKKSLSLQQGLGQGGPPVVWYDSLMRDAHWAADGRHVVVRNEGVKAWLDPESGAESKPGDDAADEPRRRARRRGRRGGARSDSWVKVIANDVFFGEPRERDAGKLRRLTDDGQPKDIAQASPDKSWASFVRGGNLVVVAVADGADEWAVTSDGSERLLNGKLDWVYQEEVYGRGDFRASWWSGDSKAIAFLRLDESAVKPFELIDFLPKRKISAERSVALEVMNYPKAGDPNPTVQLEVAWPETQTVVDVPLEGYDDDVLIVRVGWTGDHQLLFAVQDRIQTWLDLNVADPSTGKVTRLIREEAGDHGWVNRLPLPRWLDDGTFLWFSERTGYQHLYHYRRDGTLVRAVTSGEWQVRGIERVAEVAGKTTIWFTGTKDGAINDNLYRVGLDGQGLTRLTDGDGQHSTTLNKDGSWFLDSYSSITQPREVRLCSGDGLVFRVIDSSKPAGVKDYVYSPKQSLTIPARDGYLLDATLIVPPNFDPQGKYPIYLPTYSGPDAPSVRNGFRISNWEQYLAQQGALILQVNVRSASGRGQAHTAMAYKRLGVAELRDLEDAVAYICDNHAGDPARVAIDGWSYGGFMAAYALTHSDKFSLGIAGAGVHDWQLYDTIYTERYMSTPQLNPSGYQETSVIEGAKNLHGHLVLMHGARDDNVHLQNSMRLIYELQAAGKDDFELMIYPRSRHGVGSPHRRRFVWRAIERYLLR